MNLKRANHKQTGVKANCKQTGVKASRKQTGVEANRKETGVKKKHENANHWLGVSVYILTQSHTLTLNPNPTPP